MVDLSLQSLAVSYPSGCSLSLHPPRLNSHIAEVVDCLQQRGTHVYLISGGFTHV